MELQGMTEGARLDGILPEFPELGAGWGIDVGAPWTKVPHILHRKARRKKLLDSGATMMLPRGVTMRLRGVCWEKR